MNIMTLAAIAVIFLMFRKKGELPVKEKTTFVSLSSGKRMGVEIIKGQTVVKKTAGVCPIGYAWDSGINYCVPIGGRLRVK